MLMAFPLHTFIILGIENESSGGDSSDDPLVLPDIKDMLKKKEIQQENERIEEEKRQSVKKIKRSDKEAFRKVSVKNMGERDARTNSAFVLTSSFVLHTA